MTSVIDPHLRSFREYVKYWYGISDDLVKKNIKLKEEHTLKVRQNVIDLGTLLQLSQRELFLVELIALYHDIARFKQFYYYKTFDDKKSFDHADEGVNIIKENGFLKDIARDDQNRIFSAIKYHNKKNLPDIKDNTEKLFAMLIRDADKLDIWRIVGIELAKKDDPSITLGYTGKDEFNPEIVKLIKNRDPVDYKLVRSTLDFKLITLGWIYDINFKETFLLINKNRVLDPILVSLPNIAEVLEIKEIIKNHIEKFLNK